MIDSPRLPAGPGSASPPVGGIGIKLGVIHPRLGLLDRARVGILIEGKSGGGRGRFYFWEKV
jgi:hypothetical protein